jgi:hypothetical protein
MTTLRLALLLALVGSAQVFAEPQGQYREFQLGASTASVSALTGTRSADVKLVHERPALMQELRWSPSSFGTAAQRQSLGEAIQQIVFSFYNDQLSRLMIEYERSRTLGMTDHDMVDALSLMYGPPSSTMFRDEARGDEIIAARSVARWNGADYTVVLSRWAYGAAFRLVVESTHLASLARVADARAIVLDIQEGPKREADRARVEQQQKDVAEATARAANKAIFQP